MLFRSGETHFISEHIQNTRKSQALIERLSFLIQGPPSILQSFVSIFIFYFFSWPDKSRFYTIHDILDTTQQNRINKLLKDYFVNESDCFTIAPTIDKVTAVNVTSKSVLFTFAHYILGPYYCGAPTIEVPLIELKGIYKL